MNFPQISFIIPCYNDWQYIEKSVNSALNQTYSNIEVIIVDDGSNESTKSKLKHLEPKITKLITQENQGQSKARNVGIEASKGEFIVTLDSDDFFEPTFCEQALNHILKPKVKIVSCYIKRFNNNRFIDIYKHNGGDIKRLCLNNQATGSVMFRKSDWLKVKGYDEEMNKGFEDWEFYIRLLKNGGELFVIEEPLFNYRVRHDSTTSKANKMKYDLRRYIYIKHKEIYMEYFELFVEDLLFRIRIEEKEKIKNTKRIEFKIGKIVLTPLRFLKKLLR